MIKCNPAPSNGHADCGHLVWRASLLLYRHDAGAARLCWTRAKGQFRCPPVPSRCSRLLPSLCAHVRAILMTSSLSKAFIAKYPKTKTSRSPDWANFNKNDPVTAPYATNTTNPPPTAPSDSLGFVWTQGCFLPFVFPIRYHAGAGGVTLRHTILALCECVVCAFHLYSDTCNVDVFARFEDTQTFIW